MTAELDGVLMQIFTTPEGKADPYPHYRRLREHGPAYRSAFGGVVVSHYAECQAALRDPRIGQPEPHASPWELYGLTEAEWMERFPDHGQGGPSMLGLNPPDHTRLRSLVAKAFTPSTVERLRPRITALTDDLIGDLDGEVDVIAALALQLPISVIGEMLGVPPQDRKEMQPQVREMVRTLEPNQSLDDLTAAAAAMREVTARFEELMAARRDHPTDDLLCQLMSVEEQGDRLTHAELMATVVLLFIAGFETTTNLIGNGLLALLEHPDQMQRLRDDPTLVRSAVDELLRWDAPVQLTGRTAFADLEMGGAEVKAGEQVLTLLGSANRDGARFDDPDRLDVGRTGAPPLSFGSGIHFCLGAALARAEGQVAFTRLLERFPVIEPAWGEQRPPYRDSIVLHGLERLPVRFGRG